MRYAQFAALVLTALGLSSLFSCSSKPLLPDSAAPAAASGAEKGQPAREKAETKRLEPGKLVLVSQDEVALPPKPPLLPNGGFEEWTSGMPTPKYFTEPDPKRRLSSIQKETSDVAAGTITLKQTWNEPDGMSSALDQFGIQIVAPQAKMRYRFSAKAKNMGASKVRISVWQNKLGSTELERLSLELFSVPGGMQAYQEFSGQFTSGETSGAIHIVSVFPGPKEGEAPTVLWDDWALEELK